jgi:uncharacterized protein YoxC
MVKLDCDLIDDGKTIRFPRTLVIILAGVIVLGVVSWSVLKTANIPETYAKTEYVDKCIDGLTRQHQIDLANSNQRLIDAVQAMNKQADFIVETVNKFERSVNKRFDKIEQKIDKP